MANTSCPKDILKAAHKIIVKLTPMVNFTIIFKSSFCQKITNPNCRHIKAGNTKKKASRKVIEKLTPVVNFINILLKSFLYESAFSDEILLLKPKCN